MDSGLMKYTDVMDSGLKKYTDVIGLCKVKRRTTYSHVMSLRKIEELCSYFSQHAAVLVRGAGSARSET